MENRKLDDFTSEQRNTDLHHHIDAGFINHRKCFSVFGNRLLNFFQKNKIPGDDNLTNLYNNHYLVFLVLMACKQNKVRTLSELLFGGIKEGELFASTEHTKGKSGVTSLLQGRNQIMPSIKCEKKIFLEFTKGHFLNDTGRLEQEKKAIVSIVGQVKSISKTEIIIHPLIMGAPTYDHELNKEASEKLDFFWEGWSWYESYPEDIDEFAKMKEINEIVPDEWIEQMSKIPERKVKELFCELLQEIPAKDWGGEFNDLFTAHINLSGRRTTAAFVLKGPSKFRPMTIAHLGKNADQIYRLACSPASILIIQHSHQILEPVRATLRAFAVSPSNPRRYCLIDGRDTYRILKAYKKI
jgi:hypothetical protein